MVSIKIDFSLWESRIKAVNDFITHYSFDTTGFVFISLLGFLLVISAMLGFGFYLWHLKNSNQHSQIRLLNILNGYLSAVCMILSPAVFIMVLHVQSLTTKIYYKDVPVNEFLENEKMIERVTVIHIIGVSVLFLLISFATVLNHFKPGLYLDISLNWRHKFAIPVMVISFILAEQILHASCLLSPVSKCKVVRMRTMVIMIKMIKTIMMKNQM